MLVLARRLTVVLVLVMRLVVLVPCLSRVSSP